MIDYTDLIGVPFKIGGRGPECFDCYGLVRECYLRNGKTIPDYRSPEAGNVIAALISTEAARIWKQTDQKAGTTALIRVPGFLHVGFMVDDDNMIHAWKDTGGVTIEPIEIWKKRVIGFYEYGN